MYLLFPFQENLASEAPMTNICNLNAGMDKYLHPLLSVVKWSIVKYGMELLIHSKLQRLHRWSLGMDK